MATSPGRGGKEEIIPSYCLFDFPSDSNSFFQLMFDGPQINQADIPSLLLTNNFLKITVRWSFDCHTTMRPLSPSNPFGDLFVIKLPTIEIGTDESI